MAQSPHRALVRAAKSGILVALGGAPAGCVPPGGAVGPPPMPEYPPEPPPRGSSSSPAAATSALSTGPADHRVAVRQHGDCRKGRNDCKGKGNCKTSLNACKAQNNCKGQGGCRPAVCP